MQVNELQQLIAVNPDRVLVIDVRERDEVAAEPLFPCVDGLGRGECMMVMPGNGCCREDGSGCILAIAARA